jgi:plastocyanin
MRQTFKRLSWLVFLVGCAGGAGLAAQDKAAIADVVIARAKGGDTRTAADRAPDASNVAVWLTPLDRTNASGNSLLPFVEKPPELVQRHKTFEPHVLVVQVGTLVAFPNKDPFFHNIFSLYDGKRFDLGLYEAGTTRSVLFDRPGVSFLFCNIHAEMSAVVVAVDTRYFGLSDRSGHVIIPNLPEGRYQLNVWYERSLPEILRGLTRVVTISDATRNVGVIRIPENSNFTPTHKNKYGLEYVPPPHPDYDYP